MAKNHTKRNTKTKKRNVRSTKRRSSTKRQNKKTYIKKGGAKFGLPTKEYVLPEDTYLYLGETERAVNNSEIIEFNFEGKNVGVMSGCFCPPHAGHFQTIYDACVKNNLGVMFIKTTNLYNKPEKTKHGIPSAFTIKLLRHFARHIRDKLGTEFFITNSAQEVPWAINTTMKSLMLIQVTEIDGKPTEEDIKNATIIEQQNPLSGKSRGFLEKFDRENNEKVVNRVLFRNTSDKVSATSFVRSLMRILETPDDADAYAQSAKYLPPIFNDEEKYAIIDDMLMEFGAYLK
uniref:Uncharacterized protein n=1 Tax=viral metagenome TaxID=1070528 RepID=A0A6C0BW30_9ZZZZ